LKEEPWSYRDGNRWIGYCVDLMEKLSEMLKISYSAIRITDIGSRTTSVTSSGETTSTFTGTIGQLIRGVKPPPPLFKKRSRFKVMFRQDVDIIAAPLAVTTDRDEFVNFVEPYFERNGLMIGIKRLVYQLRLSYYD
jgi:hypothetical protein